MDEPSSTHPKQPPQWKHDLAHALVTMVDALPDDADPSGDPTEFSVPQPTLEEFYRALIALEANTRKNVQKTNGALDSVAKGLRGLQLQLSQIETNLPTNEGTDYSPILAINGQLLRMLESLQTPPSSLPLGLSRKWQDAWADVTSGTEIVQRSIIQLLNQQGIVSRSPAIDELFDPASMEAIKVSAASDSDRTAKVIAVIEPAYYQNEKLIRCARVHVQR